MKKALALCLILFAGSAQGGVRESMMMARVPSKLKSWSTIDCNRKMVVQGGGRVYDRQLTLNEMVHIYEIGDSVDTRSYKIRSGSVYLLSYSYKVTDAEYEPERTTKSGKKIPANKNLTFGFKIEYQNASNLPFSNPYCYLELYDKDGFKLETIGLYKNGDGVAPVGGSGIIRVQGSASFEHVIKAKRIVLEHGSGIDS